MTPAIVSLSEDQQEFRVLEYAHSAAVKNYGDEVIEQLGLDPLHVFKTLLAQLHER